MNTNYHFQKLIYVHVLLVNNCIEVRECKIVLSPEHTIVKDYLTE